MDKIVALTQWRFSHKLLRRLLAATVTIAAVLVVYLIKNWATLTFHHAAWFTGWTLIATILALACLSIRRRFIMLPLVPLGFWVQFHVYAGLFTVAVYFMHAPRLWVSGGLEGLLSILVWLTCGSGIYGLYLSRTAPKRLSGIGHEVRYDHIAWHRSRVVERAEVLIGSFPATTGREVLDEYYHTRLKVFFQSQPGWLYFLFPTVQRRKRLLAGLTENYRYLPPELKAIAGELAALVRNRDDLDYHHAMQWRLRTWRYLHILLTALLILSASMHIVLAWRMEGM